MLTDTNKNSDDRQLITEIRSGQTEKFSEITQRYQQRIFSFLYRFTQNTEDAKDLTQETLIRAFFKLSTFKIEKKFSTWLFSIAHHQAINFYKKKKNNLSLEELQATGQEVAQNWQPSAEQQELHQQVRRALSQLPAKYRAALTLYYLEELSYQEISEITKLPLNTVRTHLHRAKLLLEKKLSNYDRATT